MMPGGGGRSFPSGRHWALHARSPPQVSIQGIALGARLSRITRVRPGAHPLDETTTAMVQTLVVRSHREGALRVRLLQRRGLRLVRSLFAPDGEHMNQIAVCFE